MSSAFSARVSAEIRLSPITANSFAFTPPNFEIDEYIPPFPRLHSRESNISGGSNVHRVRDGVTVYTTLSERRRILALSRVEAVKWV